MTLPLMRAVWGLPLAALFLFGPAHGEGLRSTCELHQDTACSVLDESVQFACRKQVNQARAVCRKAHRAERFGTHQEHCEVSCKAQMLAADLDLRLRQNAIDTIKLRSAPGDAWRAEAVGYWTSLEVSAGQCSSAEVRDAFQDCKSSCAIDNAKRDLKEMQSMTRGEELLPIVQPEFSCSPGGALDLFRSPQETVADQLYPPGDPQRRVKQ